jgi:hypothetical protein
MPSLKHNCSDELYARLQQGPCGTFADNSIDECDSSHVFTFLVSELRVCFETCCKSAECKQCRQVLVDLLFSTRDLCNCEKESIGIEIGVRQALRGV